MREAPYPPPVYRPGQSSDSPPPPPQPHDLAWLAELLDSRWRIPGTSWRFGLDAVAGLIPGAGDLVAGLAGATILFAAHRAGVPNHILARMIGNIALDTVIGSIPVLGSIFDVFYKSNKRNLRLYEEHLAAMRNAAREDPRSDKNR